MNRIAGATFNVADIIGKTLYPNYQVDVYNNTPSSGGGKIAVIKSGNPAGVVYSWVEDTTSKQLWWQFKSSDGSFYYIEHKAGRFNVKSLKDQGVLTVLEKIEQEKEKEEQENKPWYEKLGEGITGTIFKLALVGAGAYVVSEFIKTRNVK